MCQNVLLICRKLGAFKLSFFRIANAWSMFSIFKWFTHSRMYVLLLIITHKHSYWYHLSNTSFFLSVNCTPIFAGIHRRPFHQLQPKRPPRERAWAQQQRHRGTTKHVGQHDYWGQNHIGSTQTRYRCVILPVHQYRNWSWTQHIPSVVEQRDVWTYT